MQSIIFDLSIIFSYIRHSLLKSSFQFPSPIFYFLQQTAIVFIIIFINSNTAHLHIQKTKYSESLKYMLTKLSLLYASSYFNISHSFIYLVSHSFIQKYLCPGLSYLWAPFSNTFSVSSLFSFAQIHFIHLSVLRWDDNSFLPWMRLCPV